MPLNVDGDADADVELDLNLVEKFVEQHVKNSPPELLYKLDNDQIYNYIKTTLQQLNDNFNVSSGLPPVKDNEVLRTICQTERLPSTNSLMTNIIFIRISTRNAPFVENYFTTSAEDKINLFGLLLNHYQSLIKLNALKNNYMCEIAKIISNTIIQTKNFPTTNNYQAIMSLIKPLVVSILEWLEYNCKFDEFTSECMYHHFRWIFLICTYNPWAKDILLANHSLILTWYERMYDFLDKYIHDYFSNYSTEKSQTSSNKTTLNSNSTEEHIDFCSKVLFPCANTLFNITHSLSDHPLDYSPTAGELSPIFYKYMYLIHQLYKLFENNNTMYASVVALLCSLMSCLSCGGGSKEGGVFDVFSLEENDPLVSKSPNSTPLFLRKTNYIGSFSDTFGKYNVSRIVFLMEILLDLISCVLNSPQMPQSTPNNSTTFKRLQAIGGDRSGDLIKFLVGMIALCRYSNKFRRYVRFQIIPPLKEESVQIRPEQEQSLRGYFTRLLTTTDFNLNMVVGEFLYVLCRENVDRLVKYVGMGNAMGFMHHRGLLAAGNVQSSTLTDIFSSDNSDIEDYENIAEQVDPITGAISKHHPQSLESSNDNPQTEEELNSLMDNIQKLQKLDIITTANISNDGKVVKSVFPNDNK